MLLCCNLFPREEMAWQNAQTIIEEIRENLNHYKNLKVTIAYFQNRNRMKIKNLKYIIHNEYCQRIALYGKSDMILMLT